MNREKDMGPISRKKVPMNCDRCATMSSITQLIGYYELSSEILCITCLMSEVEDTNTWDLEIHNLGKKYLMPYWTPKSMLKKPDTITKSKEYWYFLTWTHNDNHSIEDVWSNIERFKNRDLGFLYIDVVLEHGTDSDREHYHMRVKASKLIRKHYVQHYEKVGHIDFVTIRKHTQGNWENLEGYMNKESTPIVLYTSPIQAVEGI